MANNQNILGSIIPRVYIKKITLETSGGSLKERNPHIDHEREPDVIVDPITGKTRREENVPDFTKKPQISGPMRVVVDLVLKEKLDNSLLSTWFSNIDFVKFLGVKVFQTENIDIINGIKNGKLTFDKAEKLILQRKNIQKVGIKEIIKNKQLDLFPYNLDENGDKIYEIPIKFEFKNSNSNPKQLAVFAVSFLDIESMARDFEMEIANLKNMQSTISSELVIDDYSVISNSYLFLDENGNVWTGPVFQLENGQWVGGAFGDSQKLQIKTIANSKIQDFRALTRLERLILNFQFIENELFLKKNKILAQKNLDIQRKKTYFTEFYLSRDSDGNARFIFGLDYLKLIRERTIFGKLYENGNEELLKNVRIRSLKVERHRISSNPNSILNERGIAPFDELNIPFDNVVVSAETIPGNFKTSILEKGSLREIKILHNDSNGVRYFTGIDKTMKKVTSGIYKYAVKIEVEDRTKEWLRRQLYKLGFARKLLEELLENGTQKGNFDNILNRFTRKFIDEQEAVWGNREDLAPWTKAVALYIEVLSFLVQDLNVELFEANLLTWIHPATGNPVGINAVIKLIDNINVQVEKVVGKNSKIKKMIANQRNSAQEYQPNLKRANSPLAVVEEEHFSEEFFDSDLPKFVGYDYLSLGEIEKENTDDGLKVMSNLKYKKRVEKETLKYYKSLEADINLNANGKVYTATDDLNSQMFSFLSPSNLSMGAETKFSLIKEGAGTFEEEQSKTAMAKVINFKAIKMSPWKPLLSRTFNSDLQISEEKQEQNQSATDVFATIGVTVVSVEEEQEKQQVEETVKISSFVGETSKQLTEDKISEEKSEAGAIPKFNPNSIFIAAMEEAVVENMTAEPVLSLVESKPLLEETKKKDDGIKLFDITSEMNILDKAKETKDTIQMFEGVSQILPGEEGIQQFAGTSTALPGVEQEEVLQFSGVATALPGVKVSGTKEERIKMLPNQIKSLFVGSVSSDSVIKPWTSEENDASKSSVYRINYQLLNEIEVLFGYEKSGLGERQVRKPIWKRLTPQIFNLSLNGNLLCRLKPYTNKEFAVKFSKALELPIYNKYFILSPEEFVVEPTEEKPSRGAIVIGRITSVANIQKEPNADAATSLPFEGTATALPGIEKFEGTATALPGIEKFEGTATALPGISGATVTGVSLSVAETGEAKTETENEEVVDVSGVLNRRTLGF